VTARAAPPPGLPLRPRAVAAVLLESPDPRGLAAFYREVLGVPFEPVAVPGVAIQEACELGEVYLGIGEGPRGPGKTCLALMVDDVAGAAAALKAAGVALDWGPRQTELGTLVRFKDPDGNPVELYQP
jgi:predicted enzyme related to lactoylglutathione lyase